MTNHSQTQMTPASRFTSRTNCRGARHRNPRHPELHRSGSPRQRRNNMGTCSTASLCDEEQGHSHTFTDAEKIVCKAHTTQKSVAHQGQCCHRRSTTKPLLPCSPARGACSPRPEVVAVGVPVYYSTAVESRLVIVCRDDLLRMLPRVHGLFVQSVPLLCALAPCY